MARTRIYGTESGTGSLCARISADVDRHREWLKTFIVSTLGKASPVPLSYPRAFLAGMTPEQIVQDFDALTVENAYATINYDLHHREEVEAYLQTASEDASRSRDEMEKPFETTASELSFLRAGG